MTDDYFLFLFSAYCVVALIFQFFLLRVTSPENSMSIAALFQTLLVILFWPILGPSVIRAYLYGRKVRREAREQRQRQTGKRRRQ